MPALARSAPDRSVTTRRMSIDHDDDMPRHLLDGNLSMSHVMAVLSATFHKGEQFFADSVRNYRHQIDDDELVGSAVTDPAARNPIRFVGSLLNLRNSPFARKKIGLRLFDYQRPGFHPDDRDTENLAAHSSEALFGEHGTLNEYLAGQRQPV